MKIAIYGKRAHGVDWETGWYKWGFNPPTDWDMEQKFDLWFELHDLGIHEVRRPWYLEWLRDRDQPVMLQAENPEIPHSHTFPAEDLEAAFNRGWYHCGSVDWLVAYAIMVGATSIALYGMEYDETEPDSARACLEYWCGVAEGGGIEVISPDLEPILINATRMAFRYWDTTRGRYGYDVADWLTDEELGK